MALARHPSSCPVRCFAHHRMGDGSRVLLHHCNLRCSFCTPGQTTFLQQALADNERSSQTGSGRSSDATHTADEAAASGEDLLSWSFAEGTAVWEETLQQQQLQQQPAPPGNSAAAAPAAVTKQRQQQTYQPRPWEQDCNQKQQQAPPRDGHRPGAGPWQRLDRASSNGRQGLLPERPAAGHSSRAASPSSRQKHEPQRKWDCHPSHAGDAAGRGLSNEAFQAMQQRVLQLLVSADITNPEAAAQQLPDSINEIVVALQLLATAPRPKPHVALRQYEAATAALAGAVLQKFKRLLLQNELQRQQQQQHHNSPHSQQQQPQPSSAAAAAVVGSSDDGDGCLSTRLAAALVRLPATKVAAATFSLGVLRQYDPSLIPALEAATGQLLARSAFSANQLGQLGQGFAYLDHPLNPDWQQDYILAIGRHLPTLKAAQLASVSEFLLKYKLRQFVAGTFCLGSSSVDPAAAAAGAAAVSGLHAGPLSSSSRSADASLPADWVCRFLAASGTQARSLKPSQLAQVLAAAAAMYRQQLQHQAALAALGAAGRHEMPAALAGLPMSLSQGVAAVRPAESTHFEGAAAARRSGSNQPAGGGRAKAPAPSAASTSSSSSKWLASLLAAFQRQLPDMTLPYLAAALPALATLTSCPWPQQQLQPVLLQVRLLLPAAGGSEIVAAAAGAAQLAGSGRQVTAVDDAWCDALLQRVHAVLTGLGARELAAVIRALALLKVRPYRAWVYELCGRLRVEAKGFSAAEVVDVVEGLAQLRIVLDPEVLHLFVLGIQRWMLQLGSRDLGRLAQALRAMYPRVLPGRTVQQLVKELERRSKFLQLQQQQQQQNV